MSANNSNNDAKKQRPKIIHESITGNSPAQGNSNRINKKAVSNPVPGNGGKKNK